MTRVVRSGVTRRIQIEVVSLIQISKSFSGIVVNFSGFVPPLQTGSQKDAGDADYNRGSREHGEFCLTQRL